MKITQINTYDVQGGAARAAYRLHKGLLNLGQDSTLLSRFKVSSDRTVEQISASLQNNWVEQTGFSSIQSQYIDANRTAISNTLFSLPYPGYDLSSHPAILQADVINLHWVTLFQSPITLKRLFALGKPVVWTLHDMWSFTGGCHYSAGCQKYEQDCVQCPQLADDPENLAAAILKDKLECFTNANLTIVSPSQWLADCAKQSRLLRDRRVEVIPNSVEVEAIFTPSGKPEAKQAIGVNPQVTTLLFGAGTASENRKGFPQLLEAMQYCRENEKFRDLVEQQQVTLLCFGYASELIDQLEIPVKALGAIDSDFQLSQIYAAADLFVLPSLEDNLPNTMLEAMSCGTPVVAFEVGGIPDVVQDGITGRLAPPGHADRLAAAILDCVFDPVQRQQMGHTSRQVIETQYSLTVQAQRYLALYQELGQTSPASSPASIHLTNHGELSMSGAESQGAVVPLETASAAGFNAIANSVTLRATAAQLQQNQTQLQQLKADFQQSQTQLQQSQTQLQQSQTQLQETQKYLQQAQEQVAETENAAAQTQALLMGEKRITDQLRQEMQAAEIARAKLIQELRQNNEALKQQLHSLHAAQPNTKNTQIQDLKATIRQWRQQANQTQQENSSLCQSIAHLEQELAYRSTARAAVRQLIKTGLRKTGLFGFVYNRYQAFVPIYNVLFRDKWQPATLEAIIEADAPPAEPPQQSSESALELASKSASKSAPKSVSVPAVSHPAVSRQTPLPVTSAPPFAELASPRPIDMEAIEIEAFVIARHYGVELDQTGAAETIQQLAQFLTEVKRVFAVNPAANFLPLLQSLAKTGEKVTCVGCSAADRPTLEAYGLEVITEDLSSWMIAANQFQFHDYDAICLNADSCEAVLLLLKGRLSAQTQIVVYQNTDEFTPEGSHSHQLGDASRRIDMQSLSFYATPTADWVTPFRLDASDQENLWPWNYSVPDLPTTLPSGKPLPKISVITVTWNQGKYIEETLRSVLLQGYPNLEYIVLDGGSTDNTLEILDRYRSQLAYCVSEPDEGQSNALNKGFSQATGEIVAWLNSDDCYFPDTLYRIALAFETYGTDMVSGGCLLRNGSATQSFTSHHSILPIGKPMPLPIKSLLDLDNCWQQGHFFYQPEVFWTKELWERAGAYVREDLFYSMDYELWLRMAHKGATIVHVPDPIALYRVHERQKTYGDEVPFLPELRQVVSQFERDVLTNK